MVDVKESEKEPSILDKTNTALGIVIAFVALMGAGYSFYIWIFPTRAALHIGIEDTRDFTTLKMVISNQNDAAGSVGDELDCVAGDFHLHYESVAPTVVPARGTVETIFTTDSTWAMKLATSTAQHKKFSQTEAAEYLVTMDVPEVFACSIKTNGESGEDSTKFPRNQIHLFVVDNITAPTVRAYFSEPI